MTSPVDDNVTCVILADRHAALAERLRELLRDEFGAVFTVANSRSLLEGAKRLLPALIVVDLGFGEEGMTQLIRQIRSEVPEARVVALTLYEEPEVARAVMAEGADAVVLKRSIGDELLDAIHAVLSGGSFVSPRLESG